MIDKVSGGGQTHSWFTISEKQKHVLAVTTRCSIFVILGSFEEGKTFGEGTFVVGLSRSLKSIDFGDKGFFHFGSGSGDFRILQVWSRAAKVDNSYKVTITKGVDNISGSILSKG